jgi:hypothetical protein
MSLCQHTVSHWDKKRLYQIIIFKTKSSSSHNIRMKAEWHSFLWLKGQNFLRGFGNLLVRTEARRMKIFMAFSKDGWVTKIPPHSYGGMMR